ncbi:hypothetical protein [Streptomyces sp. SP18CS02]|uniref:hypothetical protein n=1 Tax=Streptomyces sp. SP18CS02 TaxID=3002531 RepID=UPI002E7809C1|nr:hypothetical protein [Streptomyces sp. SP18CS02]MEE1756753.1 hypothetical protein [Streptomyces sp. SP18CS02]
MDAHRLVRTGVVAAAGLVTALALTGCGGDRSEDTGQEKDAGGASAAPAPAGSAGGPATGPGPAAGGGTLAEAEGSWTGVTDGKPVSLTIKKGQALVIADAHVCRGQAKEAATVTLHLTCNDGDTDRTTGTVESSDASTLVVSWGTGRKDTLTKAAPAGIPSSLPSLPPRP